MLLFLAVLGSLVISIPVFAFVNRDKPMDSNIAARSATLLIGKWLRAWLVWVLSPAEGFLVKMGVSPTALNIFGALFGAAAGLQFARYQVNAAAVLIILGGLADVLDGRVARARGIASARGAFLDSALDRFSETFTYIGLIYFFGASALSMVLTAAALGGSMLVSYTRARGEGVGVSNAAGLMQRTERLVLLSAGAFAEHLAVTRFGYPRGDVLTVFVAIIAIGTYGTAIFRTVAIAKALSQKEGFTISRSRVQ